MHRIKLKSAGANVALRILGLVLLVLAGCGKEVSQGELGEGRFAVGADVSSGQLLAQTNALLTEVKAAKTQATKASRNLGTAKGALLGISTTGLFGKKPTGFQLALANGALSSANYEFKKLHKMVQDLQKKAAAYDVLLGDFRRSGIGSTLASEFTVAVVWKYDQPSQFSYFNLVKLIEVERTEAEVHKMEQALATLETKLTEVRSKL
jgi:hypothetical protein